MIIPILLILLIFGVIIWNYYSSTKSSSLTNTSGSTSSSTPQPSPPSSVINPPPANIDVVPPPYIPPTIDPLHPYIWALDVDSCDCTTGMNRYKCMGPNGEFYDPKESNFPCDNSKIPTSKCSTDMWCKPYDISASAVSVTPGKDNYGNVMGYTIKFPPMRGATRYFILLKSKTRPNTSSETTDVIIPCRISEYVISQSISDPLNTTIATGINSVDFINTVYKLDIYDLYIYGENTHGRTNPVLIGVLDTRFKYVFLKTGCDCTSGNAIGTIGCVLDSGEKFDPEVCRRMGLTALSTPTCYDECPIPTPIDEKNVKIIRNKLDVDVVWTDTLNSGKNITEYIVDVFRDGDLAGTVSSSSPFTQIRGSDGIFKINVANVGEGSSVRVDIYVANKIKTVKTSVSSPPVAYSWGDKLCDCSTLKSYYKCTRNGVDTGITTNTMNGTCGNLTTPSGSNTNCSVGCPISLQPPQNLKSSVNISSTNKTITVSFSAFVPDSQYNDIATGYKITVVGINSVDGTQSVDTRIVDRQPSSTQTFNFNLYVDPTKDIRVDVQSYYSSLDGGIYSTPSSVVISAPVSPVITGWKSISDSDKGESRIEFYFDKLASGITYNLYIYPYGESFDVSRPVITGNTQTINLANIGLNRDSIYYAIIRGGGSYSNTVFFRGSPSRPTLSMNSYTVSGSNSAIVNITTSGNYLRFVFTDSSGNILSSTDYDNGTSSYVSYNLNVPLQYPDGTYYYRIMSGYRRDIITTVVNKIDVISDPSIFAIIRGTPSTTTTTPSPQSLVYSATLESGKQPGSDIVTQFNNFITNIPSNYTDMYSRLEFSSSLLSQPVILVDKTIINGIIKALKGRLSFSATTSDTTSTPGTWYVSLVGSTSELTFINYMYYRTGDCVFDTRYGALTLRPGVNGSGWGGAGATCNAQTQTITLKLV